MAIGVGQRGFRMRPLSIGDILDESLLIYRRQFVAFVTLMGVVVVPASLVSLVPVLLVAMVPGRVAGDSAMWLMAVTLLITVPVTIVAVIARLIAGVVAIKVSSDVLLGHPVDVWGTYRLVFSRTGAILVASLLVGLVTGASLICFPVAIFFTLSWGLMFPAIILEGHGGVEALRRSWELTRDHRWRLLACSILIGLIATILISVPAGLFGLLAAVGVVVAPAALVSTGGTVILQTGQVVFQALGETLFGGVAYIVMTRFYYDVRVRKEAFDLALRLPPVASAPVPPSSDAPASPAPDSAPPSTMPPASPTPDSAPPSTTPPVPPTS